MLSGGQATVTPAESRWLEARRFLNANRPYLTDIAVGLYRNAVRVGRSKLLSRPGWVPGSPIPIDHVSLEWQPDALEPAITGDEPESESARPPRMDGTRYPTYADAMGALARPGIFENRPVYRLVAAKLHATDAVLSFGRGAYFSTINTCEAVGHELAAAHLASARMPTDMSELPFRALIGDPCEPIRRPMLAAITTLTLRRAPSGAASFLLHWRDPARVASGGGIYQVTPVGVFQPAGTSPESEMRDFDLWRCIAREYSEELLGSPEHGDLDYATWPFFEALTEARVRGLCRPYCLGLGVDPLTLVTDILAVVVFDSATFDSLFEDLVARNAEGDTTPDVPFTAATVERFVGSEAMQPAGAGVLDLAWNHRGALLAIP